MCSALAEIDINKLVNNSLNEPLCQNLTSAREGARASKFDSKEKEFWRLELEI